MISIFNKEIKVNHFPDGTQMLLDVDYNKFLGSYTNIIPCGVPFICSIDWFYESDEECMTLWYLVNHIRK